MLRQHFIRIIFFLGIIGAMDSLFAGNTGWRADTAMVPMLPQYCQDIVKGYRRTNKFDKWVKIFGRGASDSLHHYCNGIYHEFKAKAEFNRRERDSHFRIVVGEMAYFSNSCGSRCVLYPELHTRWGWALSEQGNVADGIKHYQLAMQAKPKYSLAYVRLSDLYVGLKQPDNARNIIKQGLKANPKSRSLQRRLKELEASR